MTSIKLISPVGLISFLLVLFFVACKGGESPEKPTTPSGPDYAKVMSPDINADSAYQFVVEQLSFGFRHPGTKGHKQCADYLTQTLNRWCDTVITQPFQATLWNGQRVDGYNIIGSIAPDKEKRVMLAAHWDSRQWADHDLDTNNWRKPLMGANDGASGVAVLLEMARSMSSMPPDVGVDFILFDVEDQGVPEWAGVYEDDTWCKGSQYWSRNPHRMFYSAQYGILFDMVGSENPRFTKEEISMSAAQGIMDKVWNCAAQLGYGNIFLNDRTDGILDDHYYVNSITRIPTIDIVQNTKGISFCKQWHTVNDNIESVNKSTLGIVATVAMKTIYADFPVSKQ